MTNDFHVSEKRAFINEQLSFVVFTDWQQMSIGTKCWEPIIWGPNAIETKFIAAKNIFFVLKPHKSNDSNDFHVSEKRAFIKEDSFSGLVMTFASRHVATP